MWEGISPPALIFMTKKRGYVAFRVEVSDKDDHYEIGKFFKDIGEVTDFFGLSENTIRNVSSLHHTVRGRQPETWKVFPEDMKVIDVESELERRI